jgi:hypothetical protein
MPLIIVCGLAPVDLTDVFFIPLLIEKPNGVLSRHVNGQFVWAWSLDLCLDINKVVSVELLIVWSSSWSIRKKGELHISFLIFKSLLWDTFMGMFCEFVLVKTTFSHVYSYWSGVAIWKGKFWSTFFGLCYGYFYSASHSFDSCNGVVTSTILYFSVWVPPFTEK